MSSNDNINYELLTLIWVDGMVDSTEENRQIQKKLRSIVNYLKTFDNWDQFEHFIKNKINDKHEKIILILSGKLGQQFIQNIHHLRQIISIFIFCGNKQINQRWAQNYKKVFLFIFI
jgi:hypothetical protein